MIHTIAGEWLTLTQQPCGCNPICQTQSLEVKAMVLKWLITTG